MAVFSRLGPSHPAGPEELFDGNLTPLFCFRAAVVPPSVERPDAPRESVVINSEIEDESDAVTVFEILEI